MPTFRYRALSQVGEIISGSIAAPTAAEVGKRIEYLGLIPIDSVTEDNKALIKRGDAFVLFSRPRPEDVTIFTGDLALLLRTGARINEALELLAADLDIGRMRSTAAKMTSAILAGESFADAIAHHPSVFPPIYVALVRVGEASGNLVPILEAISTERQRAEALRRRLSDTLRYPAFLLLGACAVLLFFLLFVLPQFANVFKDFNAKLDPVLVTFLGISDFLRNDMDSILGRSRLLAVCRLFAFSSLGGTPRGDRRGLEPPAGTPDLGISPDSPVLSQPWPAPGERGNFADELARSRRNDGDIERRVDLDPGRRQGATGRQAVGRGRANARAPPDGGAHLAPRRGCWATVDAGRARRRLLRRQVTTQPRPACRNSRSGLDHRDKHDRRRSYRLGHDRTPVSQSSRGIIQS